MLRLSGLKITPYHLTGIGALALLAVAVLIPVGLTYEAHGGRVIYSLDDPYIHLAVAKNLFQHGVWGVTPYEFSASTSSLGYPLLLLLGMAIGGVKEILPLIFNLLGAFFLLGVVYQTGRQAQFSPIGMGMLMVGTLVFLPLSSLVLTGMEHTWQVALSLALVWMLARELSGKHPPVPLWKLALLVFLVVMARYEGLFLAVVGIAGLAWRRSYSKAAAILLAAALPVVIFGLYSLSEGGMFWPNSLLIKGQRPLDYSPGEILRLGYTWIKNLYQYPHLLILMMGVGAGFVYFRLRAPMGLGDWVAVILVPVAILQLQVSGVTGQFRYFAYLVLIAWFIWVWYGESVAWRYSWQWALGVFFLFLLVSYPLMRQSVSVLKNTPQAMRNIYQQQIQMADFLRLYYPRASVAANDIGAISFFTDIRLVDMIGLGSNEVAEEILREGGRCRPKSQMDRFYAELAQNNGVKLAIVYDSWFSGCLPEAWQQVGQWTISHNVTCGDSVVSFYAATEGEKETLISRLRQFASHLPREVQESGIYLENEIKNKF